MGSALVVTHLAPPALWGGCRHGRAFQAAVMGRMERAAQCQSVMRPAVRGTSWASALVVTHPVRARPFGGWHRSAGLSGSPPPSGVWGRILVTVAAAAVAGVLSNVLVDSGLHGTPAGESP